jgi:thiamine-monophosphate kinase
VTVTVTGTVPRGRALLRSGAGEGDAIYVSGSIGAALAARRLLEGDPTSLGSLHLENVDAALRPYLLPVARVELGQRLRGIASACVDVSDGLLADLGHLCARSGVGAEIRLDSLPVAGGAPREAVVAGDDYELLFTLPAGRDLPLADSDLQLTRIGRIEQGASVRLLDADGNEVASVDRGFRHF